MTETKEGVVDGSKTDPTKNPRRRNKIVDSTYELDVMIMINKNIPDTRIAQLMLDTKSVKIDKSTVWAYREHWYPVRFKQFEMQIVRARIKELPYEIGSKSILVEKAATTVEYLEGLIKVRENIIADLKASQTGSKTPNTFVENLIHNHLYAIGGLKVEIMKATGGADIDKMKQKIVASVVTAAVKTFLPLISEIQRDEVIKMFRGEILKLQDEL